VFHVEGIDVGQLTKLVVSLDGRGSRPLWHLDYILVYRCVNRHCSSAL
jgi:hypothetical protein